MGGGEAAREAAGMRWWLVGPIRVLSAGVDGQGVQVVGQDRPAGPDSLALVTLQPAAAQVVAALEVADAALAAGAVAGQPPAVRREPGSARPEMNVLVGASLARVWAVGPGTKPPSRATSRGRRPRRSSSAAVWASRRFSAGLPAAVAAGSRYPRAPRPVLAVTSASWATEPNSLGLPNLPYGSGARPGRSPTPA